MLGAKNAAATIPVKDIKSAKATAATWGVGDDIEKIVQGLRAKGVTFEHCDMPGLTRKGDVYGSDGMKVAWFKDPDGNILALVSE